MPPAARITDYHTCPKVDPPPHVGGPIIQGETTVLIGFQPAARVGDDAKCVPAIDKIAKGEPTVVIGNKDSARIGDKTVHGGVIVQGCPTVLIGSDNVVGCFKDAAAQGAAFVEPANAGGVE
jgi:uncharacterized Zn-binding protein involved in type VI secretion